ncbi:MAG: alpha/beta hydrolase [Desulfofustis sp.]|nr:alpha/beta hydrolase [Desulfofustis sp.]
MSKTVIWILVVAGLAYASFCGLLYVRQRSMIYYPHGEVKAANLQPLWLSNQGHRLKIWKVTPEKPTAVLYFGGNAENVLHSMAELQSLYPDSSLYLMNYRGYGGSTGGPSEGALFSDAVALYDEVADSHEEVIVMGRSLGTGVAVYLAESRPVKALILVTPYQSMVALASHYYPFLPVNPLLKDRFESHLRAPRIKVPVLALVAERDEVIPAKISGGLIDTFNPENLEQVVVESAGHNTIQDYGDYHRAIKSFMSRISTESRQ